MQDNSNDDSFDLTSDLPEQAPHDQKIAKIIAKLEDALEKERDGRKEERFNMDSGHHDTAGCMLLHVHAIFYGTAGNSIVAIGGICIGG